MVGNLKAQLLAAGASANAALYRLLTPEQQAKLIQFQS
jgi:Spy/CpxP family protein refolding chaperone